MHRLFEDFRQFDRVQLLDKKVGSVCANQVVAVEIKSQGERAKKEWYRAIALEDLIPSETDKAETVSLLLIDYGIHTTAEMRHLALLPPKLLRYPTLVRIWQ